MVRNQFPKNSVREVSMAAGRLVSSFDKIRILNCVSIRSGSGSEILSRLRRHNPMTTPAAVNRLLGRMVRLGWLKKIGAAASGNQRAACQYVLTAEGRRVLEAAREQLRKLKRWISVGSSQINHETQY